MSFPTMRRWKLVLVAAAVATPLAGLVAQPLIQRDIAIINEVNPAAGKDSSQGVFVRDSAAAQDKFELGKRMERLKEWPKSADVYQEILEKFADRVVPSAVDDKNNIVQYTSVAVAVRERLARWPQEGLDVYRARYEPAAIALLESARRDDLATLTQIVGRYFVTDSAKQAAIRLIDIFMENGEFSAASQYADWLLAWHPNVIVERPRLLFRAGLAYHLSGDEVTAQQRLDELKKSAPNELARIAGADTPLVAELEKQLKEPPLVRMAFSNSASWPTVGGGPTRGVVPTSGGRPGARTWRVEIPPLVGKTATDPNGRNLGAMYAQAAVTGTTTTIMPSVDRGQAFFQDGRRVWAVQLESGVPLPGWQQSYSQSNGAYVLPKAGGAAAAFPTVYSDYGINPFPARQYSITLTDTSALAVMGAPDLTWRVTGVRPTGDNGTRLVCLDRETGRERWQITPGEVATEPAAVKGLYFAGSPLVVGDNVYVMVRGGGPNQGEECDVYCYDLATGKSRWSCFIASSGNQGGINYGGLPMVRESVSHLAYTSGRVFCVTNLGAVAAIDAYSGAIAWLDIYPRDAMTPEMAMMRGGWQSGPGGVGRPIKPWDFNPAIIQDGKLFTLPTDGKFVIVYDTASGREVKRIDVRDLGNAQDLLGVLGDYLVVAGDASSDSTIVRVNWAKWDDKQKASSNEGFWRNTLSHVRGRAFITADAAFVPTEKALYTLNLKSGKVTQRFPKEDKPWADDEGPGNIVVTEDHVIVAGAKSVNVYTDLKGVRDKYLAALSADPTNVEARLVYMEQMFNAGELLEATGAMDSAIEQLGGMRAMRAGAMRDRLFSDAITFAQKLGRDLKRDDTAKVIGQIYDRAAAAALTPSQQVNYRLSRASFIDAASLNAALESKPDLAQAVALYQEILREPAMRIVPQAAADGSGSEQAGKVAEKAINALATRSGPAIFAPFEKEAAAMLESLKASNDPDKLLGVAEVFPNAQVARQSMMLAAESYEKSAKPRLATQVLRRLYFKYASKFDTAERARLNEAMARNYWRVGNREAALARLQRGATLAGGSRLSEALVLVDGTPLKMASGAAPQTLSEAADAMAQLKRAAQSESLPDMRIPPRVKGEKLPDPFLMKEALVIANVKSLVLAPRELPDAARHDRVVAWANDRAACFEPGKAQPLWEYQGFAQAPTGLAWLDDKVLIWGGERIACLDGKTGKALWQNDLKALQQVEMVGGGTGGDAAAPPAVGGEEDAMALGARALAGRAVMIRGVLNGVQPAVAPAAAPRFVAGVESVHHVRPLTDRVVFSTSTGRLVSLDLASGNLIWQTRLANRPMDHLVASDDFTVARIQDESSVSLVVLDTFTFQQTSRKTFGLQQNAYPVNIALAPDGMLVYSTMQQMVGKDLYEPGDAATWGAQRSTGHNYIGMAGSDQFMVWGDQVLAVCDNGRFVERRQLRTGEPAGGSATLLQTKATGNDATVRMRVSGSSLYVIGAHSLVWYGLDHPDGEAPSTWTHSYDTQKDVLTLLPGDVILSRDFLVVPVTFAVPSADGGMVRRYGLHAHSIVPTKSSETGRVSQSGLLVHNRDTTSLDEPTGIVQWQGVQGGLYYVTGDEKLHMLPGSRKPANP